MTEPTPLTDEQLRNAQQVLTSMGVSAAAFAAAVTNGMPAIALAADPRTVTAPRCTHPDGCTSEATHQTSRPATDDEAAAHWDALEQNIRSKGNPEYIQNRDDTATIAEHRCDEPDHADPAYLEAVAAKTTFDTAMAELTTTASRFSAEQLRQLTETIQAIICRPGKAGVRGD